MEQRISLITLGVADLARSSAFYERLGWKRALKAAEGVAFYQTGGMALALWPREELAKDSGVEISGEGPGRVALAYNTRSRGEVDEVLREAVAAGAKIVRLAHEVFWGGYTAYFTDPDGFLWELAWNPGFALAEDGSIRIPD